jgi:hypothetical protein
LGKNYGNLHGNNFRAESRKFGSMKGLVVHIAEDFDAPLEDFKDYM